MPYVENYKEFEKRQGCKNKPVQHNSDLLFENGSMWNGYIGTDPPADKFALAKQQRIFYKSMHDKFKKEFNGYKQSVIDQASVAKRYPNVPTGDPNAPTILRELQQSVLQWRKKLEAVELILTEEPDKIKQRQRQQKFDERRAEQESLLAEISQIDI